MIESAPKMPEAEPSGTADPRPPMSYFARPMTALDIPEVAAIERECFPTGWVPTQFRRELRSRTAVYLVACRANDPSDALQEAREALLAEPPVQGPMSRLAGRLLRAVGRGDETQAEVRGIVGFVGLWFIGDEAHVTAIGVQERERRLGVGELLLLASAEIAVPRGARVMTLEVRAGNQGAQELYKKYGFARVGTRKGYYTDNNEDAFVMTTEPIREDRFLARLERLRSDHQRSWGASVRLLTQSSTTS